MPNPRGMAFTIRMATTKDGKQVENFECDNCGWRSGWKTPVDASQSSRGHDEDDCDCRLVPPEPDHKRYTVHRIMPISEMSQWPPNPITNTCG